MQITNATGLQLIYHDEVAPAERLRLYSPHPVHAYKSPQIAPEKHSRQIQPRNQLTRTRPAWIVHLASAPAPFRASHASHGVSRSRGTRRTRIRLPRARCARRPRQYLAMRIFVPFSWCLTRPGLEPDSPEVGCPSEGRELVAGRVSKALDNGQVSMRVAIFEPILMILQAMGTWQGPDGYSSTPSYASRHCTCDASGQEHSRCAASACQLCSLERITCDWVRNEVIPLQWFVICIFS